MNANEIVSLLLEDVNVVVEYRNAEINGMPHVIWLIRAEGNTPTNYLAHGTAHNIDAAQREVDNKVRLLGAKVVDVVNNVG